MKRLSKRISNSGILVIDFNQEEYQEFSKFLFTALRKFSSGKKTRAVHKLIDKKIAQPAIFSGTGSNTVTAQAMHNNSLRYSLLNMYHFDDAVSTHGTVSLAVQRMNIDKQIKREETFVDEKRLLKIEKLKENYDEITEKFLKGIDYVKMIDGIYFSFLMVLSDMAVTQDSAGKQKIVTTSADILAAVIKKLYQQVNNKMEPEVHQLIEAISIYFIKVYFYGETASYALASLNKGFSEEIVEAIQRTKVTKLDDFSDIAKLLKETELLPITPKTFDMQMERMFGKLAYEEYIQPSLTTFIAFMANMAQPNQLFKDSFPIDDELHSRLEELVLNEQKKVQIKEREI